MGVSRIIRLACIAALLAVTLLVLQNFTVQSPLRRPQSPLAGAGPSAEDEEIKSAEPHHDVEHVPSKGDFSKGPNAQAECPGYIASGVKTTRHGLTALLSLAGPECNVYGDDIGELILTVDYQTATRLSVNIQPAHLTSDNRTQYILPGELVELPEHGVPTNDGHKSDLQFSWSNDPTFSFTVIRESTQDVLFSTAGTKLVYENQFIEFVTTLPDNYNLYGLGERLHALRLGNNFLAPMWAADVLNTFDANSYGQHPFYLETRYYSTVGKERKLLTGKYDPKKEYTAESHGVWLRNTHGMEAILNPTNLTWRVLGGSIDLYFYAGPTQPEVTSQYVQSIGLPAMQQYWTLGFHQCRWGYQNWTVVKDVVAGYKQANIPLETIWTDIDYMNHYRNFENDPVRFSYEEGEEFLAELHANNQHYIPIIDSAIYIPDPKNDSDIYPVYDTGHELDVFIKNPDGSEYIGEVWPGYTVFPDWLNPKTTGWWTNSLKEYTKKVAWDGIWIDMSEVASFCKGSCGSSHRAQDPSKSMMIDTIDTRNVADPPYTIKNVNGALDGHAIATNATHYDGTKEYDVHSIFGHRILAATYAAVSTVMPSKRPFIIGRSTFAGSGHYAAHWGGDNVSKWWAMYAAIPQALTMSLFGIPFFGPDICGFAGDTNEELCARWQAVGAMMPFMRNHNAVDRISQEPYIWNSVADATRKALDARYRLLPYMYTLLHDASTDGSTVLRALAWEFPHPMLADADRQFLVGPSVLVTPVLTPGHTKVDGVFPGPGPWYDWYTHTAVKAKPWVNTTIPAPLTHLPLHIRGGSVLAMQDAGMTTAECRASDWTLLVALDHAGAATGKLYLDDGESLVQKRVLDVDFEAAAGALRVTSRGSFKHASPLAKVEILGVMQRPKSVRLNKDEVDAKWDAKTNKVTISGLEKITSKGAWAKDWTLQWQ